MWTDDDALLAIIAVCLKRKENENGKRKKRTKRLWVREYSNENRIEFTYKDLLEELKMTPSNDFRHFFATDVIVYEELLNMIGPLIKKQDTLMRVAIPVGLRLSTTLRFLATGYHFQNMTSSSTMSPVSISKIVLETCEAIIYRLKDYIKAPQTQNEWKSVANDFNEKWGFPSCLGVVNGKHIAIIKPNGTQSLYYNYKKFFSVVLIAVVNANYEFLAADVDISGNISGHEDFRHTSIGMAVCGNWLNIPNSNCIAGSEKEFPYVFVGDDGFQLTTKFMKSYPENGLTKRKQVYNKSVRRVHQVVENTFGALSSQFGVLQRPINLAPEKVKTIILACCYLYNYLRRKTANHLWDGIFDKENFEEDTFEYGSWREVPGLTSLQTPSAKLISRKAEEVREQFTNLFNNEDEMSF